MVGRHHPKGVWVIQHGAEEVHRVHLHSAPSPASLLVPRFAALHDPRRIHRTRKSLVKKKNFSQACCLVSMHDSTAALDAFLVLGLAMRHNYLLGGFEQFFKS
jgi:hypothetical protein